MHHLYVALQDNDDSAGVTLPARPDPPLYENSARVNALDGTLRRAHHIVPISEIGYAAATCANASTTITATVMRQSCVGMPSSRQNMTLQGGAICTMTPEDKTPSLGSLAQQREEDEL